MKKKIIIYSNKLQPKFKNSNNYKENITNNQI